MLRVQEPHRAPCYGSRSLGCPPEHEKEETRSVPSPSGPSWCGNTGATGQEILSPPVTSRCPPCHLAPPPGHILPASLIRCLNELVRYTLTIALFGGWSSSGVRLMSVGEIEEDLISLGDIDRL